MLVEEPFGIPVLEVPAAYSSRFSAITGEPGSRCEERAELSDYLKEALKRRSGTPPISGQPDQREENSQILKQFETLDAINARRRASGQEIPATLLLQKTGGPLFLGAKVSPIVQSDINAAINIAFRAIAAPEALHLLHRVRAESRDGKTSTVAKNARERAAYGNKGVPISIEGILAAFIAQLIRCVYQRRVPGGLMMENHHPNQLFRPALRGGRERFSWYKIQQPRLGFAGIRSS